MTVRLDALALSALLLLAGCRRAATHELRPARDAPIDLSGVDFERPNCRRRVAAMLREPAEPGAPLFEARRAAILGRAFGSALWFVEAPPKSAHAFEDAFADGLKLPVDLRPRARIAKLREQFPRRELRKMLLRGEYVYAEDPHVAYALVRELSFGDLFDEPVIWLDRGSERLRLVRDPRARLPAYRYDSGSNKGWPAHLQFGDRVAVDERELDRPLHRDLGELCRRIGCDRLRVERVTHAAILADLHFGDRLLRALLKSDGARLDVDCYDASSADRQAAAAYAEQNAWRRRARAALVAAVDTVVGEELPFDRPHDVHNHLQDGRLRPSWELAYRQGRGDYGLTENGHGYYVFDRAGRPFPPETCVAMVLDCYERAAGTWYRVASEKRERIVGAIDFSALGLENRSGVLAFEQFAEKHPELWQHTRYRGTERIPFREREKFCAFLVDHADSFAPGDVVAIQGPKPDGYVHQHAILVVDVDPVTGMPYGLADQMHQPRRRSWEGVMAEAPERALLYHLKPTDDLLRRLDPERR